MRLSRVALLALCLCACGGDPRPPLAGDFDSRRGGPPPITGDDTGSSADDAPLIVADDEGEGAHCGETTTELEIERPNFYFVLDSSESMLEPMPDSAGVTRHLAARRAVTDMLRAVGHRVNYGAALFPEGGGCEPGSEVFPVRPGDPKGADGNDGPVLDGLAFTLRKYSPAGATPVAATLRALTPALQDLEGETSVFLLTDGGPNCDLAEPCSPSQCILNIEGYRLEDGRRCDEELNCCGPEFSPHLCLDTDDTEAALADLAALGIRSYVIGIPGSEVYADVLSRMAVAAGTAREAGVPYYQVDDAAALALTLSELGQELAVSCEFDLGEPPKSPERVTVVLDGEPLASAETDGWKWKTDAVVEITGSACRDWKHGKILKVQVFEGCPFTVK